jgi:hypothetical protein
MDFSTRNKLNHQIIQNLQNYSEVTLSELSDQHIDKNESKQMIQSVFPPEEYGYEALSYLENNNDKGNSENLNLIEYYNEINELISEYAAPKSRQTTSRVANNLQAEFELQHAKEELARLKQEIEIDKIKEEEQEKLQIKVLQQRKKRKLAAKRKQEEKLK